MNLSLRILTAILIVFPLVSCVKGLKEETIEGDANNNKVSDISLLSWAEGPKNRIESWVNNVTDSSSSDFIPVKDRIAVFDNDGTLWPEQPWPNQLQFSLDFIKAKIKEHPNWQTDPFLTQISKGNYSVLENAGKEDLYNLVYASHAGMTENEFKEAVRKWIDTATNKKYHRKFDDLVYSPMLELLEYLRQNQFKTFIVSGGGADFMRVFAEEVYGIPPYQVIGSYGETAFELVDGNPIISKIEGDIFYDDKEAKPIAIHRFIGKRPVFVGGNSDGDLAMMQYASASEYEDLCVILHHTDEEREYAYDTKTLSGHLEEALKEAGEKDWLIIDMKKDFKTIFPN